MKRILVTGAAGFLGRKVVARFAAEPERFAVTATDLRAPGGGFAPGVEFAPLDLRDGAGVAALVARARPDAIVHLAAIVAAPPGMTRAQMRAVDVGGTAALLHAALAHGVRQLVVTSSGAAYGYWPDNPAWLDENDAIRGNEEFPYAAHKREVEQMLATARADHPQLAQLVLRPGTVLGADVGNQITAIFARPRILGVRGSPSPFVFIWDEDLVEIIARGVADGRSGVYNVAGDGALSIDEIAAMLGKPVLKLPAWLIGAALALLHPLRLVPWGPEQVRFLRWRPVLANARLKNEFGYTPRRTSREAFAELLAHQPQLKAGGGA